MLGHLHALPHRLLLGGMLSLLFVSAAPAEPGYLLVIRDPSGVETTIRKVRQLERNGGFYLAQSFAGKSERLDAFNVGATVDLASLELASLKDQDEIEGARALELRTKAALKKHPKLAPYLTVHLAQMRADIERAERGERKLAGTWLSVDKASAANSPKRGTINRGTLILKNGTSFSDVDILSADPKELRIVHSTGAAIIPLSQVPEEFIKKNLAPAKEGDGNAKPDR